MSANQLGALVYAFFEDQLKCQKGLRQASVRSYRDALRLFLLFVSEDSGRKLTRLSLSDLTAERVRGFLRFLEQKRHNQVRTRNHRLAAIRSFFDYLAAREPGMLSEASPARDRKSTICSGKTPKNSLTSDRCSLRFSLG